MHAIRACLAAFALSLALAGCASPPSEPVVSTAAPEHKAKFADAGGVEVAYVEFKNSAFPYHGDVPASQEGGGKPFLNVEENGRLGHQSPRGGVHWEDQTYNDRHVLVAASPNFDPKAPGVIVVYFHGNNATLARDVVARQRAPRQVAASRLNAVLVAPQMAVDARDSSAGNFWREGGFAAFLDEAETKIARFYPNATHADFARMPVVIVAYSGGYLPAAFSLAHGGAGGRIKGVVLLDALYGEPDKFARWIEQERGRAFFVSAYSASSKSENKALRARLERDGVPTVAGVPATLDAGVVAFVDSGDVAHEDFVNYAWTSDPLTDVLARVSR
ncbi:MAG: hypothetical protein KGM15_14010 [Pseudomonadota bacterium]|nr:hypothetical protein [Pseudomonadota bacterium]